MPELLNLALNKDNTIGYVPGSEQGGPFSNITGRVVINVIEW